MFQGFSKAKHLQPSICRFQRFLTTTPTAYEHNDLPKSAEIVIAGAGAIGTSVAYHLSKCGWKDIVLLEQGAPGCGTSWHAAGLCGTIRGTRAQNDLAVYATDLYSKLELTTGVATGFKRCGSLNVAASKDRALYLKRLHALSKQYKNECYIVGPDEAVKLNPFLDKNGIEMALWLPNDGLVDPTNLVQAYLKGAKQDNATIFIEGVKVTGFECEGKEVTSVRTNKGRISCGKFVNCAGLWAWELGQLSNPPVAVPLHACEHFYITTMPIEGMDSMLPVTRDYDGYTYLREWSGGLLGGGFEPNAKGTFFKKIPDNFQFQLLNEDWEQFQVLMDGLITRYPCFNDAQIRTFTNGPESFTSDGLPLVGRSPEFYNYYMAAGLSSIGIISSAGIGKALSELITYGESSTCIDAFDSRRMLPGSNNKLWCFNKAQETLSASYTIAYPIKTSEDATILNSPVHSLLHERGAVWGKQAAIWSRPLYFRLDPNETFVNGYGMPSWLPNVQTELRCLEETVGLVDLSTKSKFVIKSAKAETLTSFLQQFCLYKGFGVMKQGDIVDTILVHDVKQALVSCVDVLKLDELTFLILTDAEQHMFLESYLKDKIYDEKCDIFIDDVTAKYASFSIIGPNSEKVLADLLSPPFEVSSIRHGEGKMVDIGYATSVMLCRHLMKLEDGWQMIVPTHFSQNLYTMLFKAGQSNGMRSVGYLALNSHRIRNMIPAFGFEVGTHTTVESFYEGATSSGMSLVQMEIELPCVENWPWGGEPVLKDGHIVANLSSVGYCEENDKVLGLAIVKYNDLVVGESVSVNVGTDTYAGCVTKIN